MGPLVLILFHFLISYFSYSLWYWLSFGWICIWPLPTSCTLSLASSLNFIAPVGLLVCIWAINPAPSGYWYNCDRCVADMHYAKIRNIHNAEHMMIYMNVLRGKPMKWWTCWAFMTPTKCLDLSYYQPQEHEKHTKPLYYEIKDNLKMSK